MADSPNTSPDLKAQEAGRLVYTDQEKHHSAADTSRTELATVDMGCPHVVAELPSNESTRILRKVDYRLVPLLGLLYLVAFIDRSNMLSIFLDPIDDPR